MNKRNFILVHLAFWFIVLSINYSFLIFGDNGASREPYIIMATSLILEVIDFYIYYLFVIPFFIFGKKYFRFICITIVYTITYILFYAFCYTYVSIKLGIAESWDSFSSALIVSTYYSVFYIILSALLKMAIEGYKSFQKKLQLEKQNIRNELALLRTQLNPHFLFNTLNTIHSYIIGGNPKSAEAVIKLSDIMRYMLNDAGREEIKLGQEINYIESYINLMDFRLEKERSTEFIIKGNPEGILVPPMLFMPFIENAFKHGKLEDNNTGLKIEIDIESEHLSLKVSNLIRRVTDIEKNNNEGVGLKNVKRRLEILYPGRHSLSINENSKVFKINLEIKLS